MATIALWSSRITNELDHTCKPSASQTDKQSHTDSQVNRETDSLLEASVLPPKHYDPDIKYVDTSNRHTHAHVHCNQPVTPKPFATKKVFNLLIPCNLKHI